MRFALAALLLLMSAATAEAKVVVEQDAAGGTRAELSYDRAGDEFNRSYRDFAIRIYEDDALVFEKELAGCCRGYAPAGFGRTRSITVRDLDGGEPEVVVDFYTGGAYCCWLTFVFRRRGDTYARASKNWGPKRQRLEESRKLRHRYFRASRRSDDVKPIVAPYVATTYLLRKPDDGWDLVRRALRRGELVNHRGRYDFCPCGKRYPKRLRKFLRETGYR